MPSILIAAHNEEAVLGRCLDALITGSAGGPPEVIVIANGCTDGTAEVARNRHGVKVLELENGSKPDALNVGERVATRYPRIYLDADIVVPPGGVDMLETALAQEGTLAAVPGRVVDTTDRPWPVRAYSAVHSCHPAFRDGLFGRGMIALSEAGRNRFAEFPLMVADDLFLDSLFAPFEKSHVDGFSVTVSAPFTTSELVRRLVRVRRGNAAMRRAGEQGRVTADVRPATRWAWLKDVVVPEPRLAPAAIVYVIITLLAAILAKRGSIDAMAWGQDRSTRR